MLKMADSSVKAKGKKILPAYGVLDGFAG